MRPYNGVRLYGGFVFYMGEYEAARDQIALIDATYIGFDYTNVGALLEAIEGLKAQVFS